MRKGQQIPMCDVCGQEGSIFHHISYIPPITKPVCRSCHSKIHCGNQYPELIPLDNNGTTIHVSLDTKSRLDELKIIPREPYEDVIKRLMER